MSEHKIQLSIIGSQDRKTSGEGVVLTYSTAQRILRVAVRSVLVLAVTALTLLIPLLHFVLPFFVLAGGIVYCLRGFSQKEKLTGGEGVCPECSAPFRILSRPAVFPFMDVCESCRREVKIDLAR